MFSFFYLRSTSAYVDIHADVPMGCLSQLVTVDVYQARGKERHPMIEAEWTRGRWIVEVVGSQVRVRQWSHKHMRYMTMGKQAKVPKSVESVYQDFKELAKGR